ncbi:glutamyl- and glutaminyl-tRNA synthetase [Paramagnetospirillum caucaseum]|uniref:Glutamyl-and glutaminyl-tRNA synthetase n=1 Tax=Paramagnetospirillum caucaseum TaxID=1244869 RepID=M3AA71_9PROT|nr:tRNA glutamyl-Q(34) synthetase GluQRS [Paramagnetospirillum caucaseum]EME69404.1 glutamyl- and glutaminyl-tRNA synthetase [Paramagnetospirillum caucaseum]
MTITRFAPSPTGELHLGHAHSALFAVAGARAAHGRFLLRIEDIDRTRCRPEFTRAILTDLAWLGLEWERPVRVQSEHFDDYRAALDRLEGMGLLYPCFCTRKDIAREVEGAGHAPHGPDGPLYPGHCRQLSEGERRERREAGQPFALRLDVGGAVRRVGRLTWHDRGRGGQEARPEMFGDVVLARKDTPASYHLAVTVDDALQGVTLVTRGEDLFDATHVHRLLQALLGLPVPDYHHHRLLADEHGRRYAKRDKSLTLRALREAGRTPGEVRALAGF